LLFCSKHFGGFFVVRMVSSFLNCSAAEAETWIVNFIRLSNIEAKIDSENGIVNITKKQSNFDEGVTEKRISEIF